MDAAARRAARTSWDSARFTVGDPAEDDADALFWDSIPIDERAAATWAVSLEAWLLIDPDAENEPGLCRSVARVVRRGS